MIFRGKKPVTAFIAAAALVVAFVASGCSGSSSTSTTGWTLVGKVIDANSRVGVAGVKVCVKINGNWNNCGTTKDGSTGSMPAQAKPKYDTGSTRGDFLISGLPYLSRTTPVIVQPTLASGYAQFTTSVNFTASGTNTTSAGNANGQWDMGVLSVDKGVAVKIFIITNTPAVPVNTNGAPIYFKTSDLGDVNDVLATYVSGNQYTITLPRSGDGLLGLTAGNSQFSNGNNTGSGTAFLVVPPFKSASGLYYQGGRENVKWQDLMAEANPVINFTVDATTMLTKLGVVATNYTTMTDNSAVLGTSTGSLAITTNGLTKTGIVQLYLNLPVSLVVPTSADATAAVSNPYVISLSYTDYFKTLTKAPSLVVQTVTAVVDTTDNALITITPTATLVENQTYQVSGRVQVASDWANAPGTSGTNGTATFLDLDTATAEAKTFYVYPAAATVAGIIAPVQIDNKNGWSGYTAGVKGAASAKLASETTNASAGGASTPYLIFPEMVWGTVRLINYPGTIYEFQQKALTGTVFYSSNATPRGGVQIGGTGTSFDAQLQIGDEFTDAAGVVWKVISLNSSTSLFAAATHNSAGTSITSVGNVASPGIAATVTLREGFFSTGTTTNTIVSSQRVSKSYTNDVTNGDVLSIAGTQYTVSSVSKSLAGTGLGRDLIVSLGAADQTVIAGGNVDNGGHGYPMALAVITDNISVYGAWGQIAAGTTQTAANSTIVAADGTLSAQNSTKDTINLDQFKIQVAKVAAPAPQTTAGAGYSIGALALATGYANAACSGTIVATGTTLSTVSVPTLSGCKVGDVLAIYGNATNSTSSVIVLAQVNKLDAAIGGNVTTAASLTQISTPGAGYTATGIYTANYLGTFYDITTGGSGGVFQAAPTAVATGGLLFQTPTFQAGGAIPIASSGTGSCLTTGPTVTVTGTAVATALLPAACGVNTAFNAGDTFTLTGGTTGNPAVVQVQTAIPTSASGALSTAQLTLKVLSGGAGYAAGAYVMAPAPQYAATLGAAGSVVTTSCGGVAACISAGGSAGAIVGDLITVWNPNVGTAVGNGIGTTLSGGIAASHGTIQVTGVNPNTGVITSGVVVTPGVGYPGSSALGTTLIAPNAAIIYPVGLPGGVQTYFPVITLGSAPTIPLATGTYATTLTLGSKTERGAFGDLQKFGGSQVDALSGYVLADSASTTGDIAGLTYSIEYTNACGKTGPQSAKIIGKIAYLGAVDTANTFNWGGFDAASYFGSAAAGSAMVCDMTNRAMFGWTAGDKVATTNNATATGIAGPFAGYSVSDSSTGTPMQIRLDINVVDMAGNSLKALDTNYDVH